MYLVFGINVAVTDETGKLEHNLITLWYNQSDGYEYGLLLELCEIVASGVPSDVETVQ